MTFEQLQNLVKFVYEDTIDDLDEKAAEYLRVARLYKLPRLVGMCETALYKQLNVQNSLKTFIIAADYDGPGYTFYDSTFYYIQQ